MLNLTVLDTFLMCFLNVRLESVITPRYLKCGTSSSSTPSRNTCDLSSLVDFLLNTMHTVFLVLSMRHESLSQTCTLDSAFVSLDPTEMSSLPCVMITASSAYITTLRSGHTSGRSLMYRENSNGPKIEPCGTPTGLER